MKLLINVVKRVYHLSRLTFLVVVYPQKVAIDVNDADKGSVTRMLSNQFIAPKHSNISNKSTILYDTRSLINMCIL